MLNPDPRNARIQCNPKVQQLEERTYSLDQLLSDRMETLLLLRECAYSQLFVNFVNEPEDRPAELHPSLHDVGSIVTYNPLCCLLSEYVGSIGSGVFESEFKESLSDLDIGSGRNAVEFAHLDNVG